MVLGGFTGLENANAQLEELLDIEPNNTATNKRLGDRFIIGTSLTYIPDFRGDGLAEKRLRYDEWTWNKNIAVNLNKSIYIGLSYQNIYTYGSVIRAREFSEPAQYFLVGVFANYDFLPQKKNRLFAELSWNTGNYCTCGTDDPYYVDNLQYIGFGGGYDFPLNNYLSLDLAFSAYAILNDIEQKTAFTQYTIGLNFDLVRKRIGQR